MFLYINIELVNKQLMRNCFRFNFYKTTKKNVTVCKRVKKKLIITSFYYTVKLLKYKKYYLLVF